MIIKKIKSVKCDFHSGVGPCETITLGFSSNGLDFILGKFYFGYGMQDSHGEMYKAVELVIDNLIRLSEVEKGETK
jgi:hypothetical protein